MTLEFAHQSLTFGNKLFYRVVGTEERIPIPLMDYILNVVSPDTAVIISVILSVILTLYSP